MRSCLIQLIVLGVIGFVLLWIALPLVAGVLALSVFNASGFTGTDTKVDVRADPPPMLLTGHADTLRLRSTNAALQDLHAGSIDVTFGDVSFLSRQVGTVDGTLEAVLVPTPDGEAVTAQEVTVHGNANAAAATLVFSTDVAEQLAAARLKSVTGVTGTVTLSAPNRWSVKAPGLDASGILLVRGGELILRPDEKTLPDVVLVSPGDGNPFSLTNVAVEADGLRIEGTIDLAALIH